MRLPRTVNFAVFTSTMLFCGISPVLPVKAQDTEPVIRARAIIHGPDGDQVIDLDPSQIPNIGAGGAVILRTVGPNGEISTFTGDPSMFNLKGPGGLMINGPGGQGALAGLNVIDPGVSYLYALLKRTDVGTAIRLTARQREALEQAETTAQTARQQELQAGIAALKAGLQAGGTQDLKTTVAEHAKKLQENERSFADTRTKTLAAILKPEQLARLEQLDYQYRGPLAMGVTAVADLATLNKDQGTKISGLLKDYRQEVSKQLGFGPRFVSLKQGGAAPQAPAPPPNSEEARTRLVKADKAIRLSRQELGAKALASLPDAQREQWSKLTGKPFEFHPAL